MEISTHSLIAFYICDSFQKLSIHNSDKLLWGNQRLFAGSHVLESELAFSYLRFTSKSNKRHLLGIGISHLLLHLHTVGEDFCADACSTTLAKDRQAICRLLIAKVDEEQLRAIHSLLGIKVETIEHIIDAVGSERDANSRETWQSEDASKVVVASATSYRTNGIVESLNLENGTSVVIQATGKCIGDS